MADWPLDGGGRIMIIGNFAPTSGSFLMDIGVGAAGSEQILLTNYRVSASIFEAVSPPFSPLFLVSIPAGSRLAVRSQSNLADATDRPLDTVLYGVL